MTHYRFLLVVGAALLMGWLVSSNGPMLPEALAQQTPPRSAQPSTSLPPDQTPEADRGWFGVMVEEGANGKVIVTDVFPGGPAAFARVRKGDAVLRIGDQNVRSEAELAQAVEGVAPGDEVSAVIERNGKDYSLKVRAGSLHDFHHRYAKEMWNRDPRHADYAKSHGVSQADLTVELARRLFEQNQRLETALHDLHVEVSELRRELKNKEGAGR